MSHIIKYQDFWGDSESCPEYIHFVEEQCPDAMFGINFSYFQIHIKGDLEKGALIELQNGQELEVVNVVQPGLIYDMRIATNDSTENVDIRYIQKDVIFKQL